MARLEAALLILDGAVSARRLAHLATLADAAETRRLVDELNQAYDATGSAFRIEQVATGYQLLTRPEFALWLDRLHRRHAHLKLSPPAMETLSIVAYRQPVTRADVEVIRGVQCSEMLKQLMERNLVRIVGEDDSLGRPYLYGTTRRFLELFGLGTLDDLPMAESLRQKPQETIALPSEAKPETTEEDGDVDADAAADESEPIATDNEADDIEGDLEEDRGEDEWEEDGEEVEFDEDDWEENVELHSLDEDDDDLNDSSAEPDTAAPAA